MVVPSVEAIALRCHQDRLYADRVHTLIDENGNTYRLIEVAVENHNAAGAGDDYFTFEGDVPPAGAELRVLYTQNIHFDINYDDLGAVPPADPWAHDADACTYTIEAEDMHLDDFQVVDIDIPQGAVLEIRALRDHGEWVRIDNIVLEQDKEPVNPDLVCIEFDGLPAGA